MAIFFDTIKYKLPAPDLIGPNLPVSLSGNKYFKYRMDQWPPALPHRQSFRSDVFG